MIAKVRVVKQKGSFHYGMMNTDHDLFVCFNILMLAFAPDKQLGIEKFGQ